MRLGVDYNELVRVRKVLLCEGIGPDVALREGELEERLALEPACNDVHSYAH